MCHALISDHATKTMFTLFNMQITCKTSAPEWIKNSLELCVFVYIHFKTEDTARRCIIAVTSWAWQTPMNQISNKAVCVLFGIHRKSDPSSPSAAVHTESINVVIMTKAQWMLSL